MRRLSLLITVIVSVLFACTGKQFVSGEVRLSFSSDTIHFDTVFSSVGSATRELRVINRNEGWIKLDNIYLPAGDDSAFRLNIDGVSGNSARNIEIAPGDSIFIFIDVLVDPSSSDSPVMISDSIVFRLHGSTEYVNLIAWGQDIVLIDSEEVQSDTWTDMRPYVVYNSMMVDTNQVLTIGEGVRVLFHRGSTMYVAGTLKIDGTVENPVIFASDRLEQVYDDIPGQWNGIYFLNGSSGNVIDNLSLRGAVSGIHLGNLMTPDPPPDLQISNTVIEHCTVSGISSLGSTVNAANCVINHCGYYGLFLALGGDYEFTHSTINGYWDYNLRTSPALYLSDYFVYDEVEYVGELYRADFRNCAISGNLSDEIIIQSSDNLSLNCTFEGCLLQLDDDKAQWLNYDLTGNLLNISPGYISQEEYSLVPDTLSPLIDRAIQAISLEVPEDIRGYSRFADNGPDIGAYERQIGEKK